MAVVIETTLGDITVDLYLNQRPVTCLNFLKLCKMKYYNFNLFHTIRSGFIAQTGDPTGEGSGGESIFGLLEGPEKRFFSGETMPKIRHTDTGLLSMVCTGDMMVGSQFFFTLGTDLDSLDGVHCVIGEVTEGHEVLRKLNEVICDESHRPYQDVRITHTVILEDPFNDPKGFRTPSRSPSPSAERLKGGRIAPDEEIDEMQGRSAAEVQEMIEEKEAKARATILEIIGDIPDADIAPPENVLFVCKLNPVTTDEDLEIIFSRFGKIVSCEVIRDKKTEDSLQYAFIEFADKKSCEDAYFKMDNVLIDDRRIHVDFSQSVSKIKWLGKGRGVKHIGDENKNNKYIQEYTSKLSDNREKDRHEKKDYRERNSDRKERRHEYENNDKEKHNDLKRSNEHRSRTIRSHRERSRSRSKLENSSGKRSKLENKERYSRHGDKDNHNDDKNKSHSKNDTDIKKNRHGSPKSKASPVRSERSEAKEKNRCRSPKSKLSPVKDEISYSRDKNMSPIARASPIRDESSNDKERNRHRSESKTSPVRNDISDLKNKDHFLFPTAKASPIRNDSFNERKKNRHRSSQSKPSPERYETSNDRKKNHHMSPKFKESSIDERSNNSERNRRGRSNSNQSEAEKKRRDKRETSHKTHENIDKSNSQKNRKHGTSTEDHTYKKLKTKQDESATMKTKKHDDADKKSKTKKNIDPHTPPKEEKQKKDKTKKGKVEKAVSKNRKIKKRKPSTSSDSDSSESSSSTSSDSSSSSDSDSRRKKVRRKKRKHSTSSSSSSSESSSSSSSSDSSSDSTSSSSDSEPSRKRKKVTKNNKKHGKTFKKK